MKDSGLSNQGTHHVHSRHGFGSTLDVCKVHTIHHYLDVDKEVETVRDAVTVLRSATLEGSDT